MSLITRMLKQTCCYWAPSSVDRFSRVTYASPVQIKCRWEDTQEEFVDAQGSRLISHSKVFLASDVVPGGLLLKGDLTNDILLWTEPTSHTGVFIIKNFSKTPNLKANEFLRTAMM